MSLLFKTALKNIYKNKLSAFTLFFFALTASSVYLSTDHLKKNIEKSIAPFNEPKNTTHDFVISSSSDAIGGLFKPSVDDTIPTDKTFTTGLSQIDIGSTLVLRWLMNGNTGIPYVKIVEREETTSGSTKTVNFTRKPITYAGKPEIFFLENHPGYPVFRSNAKEASCQPSLNNMMAMKRINFTEPNSAYMRGLPGVHREWHTELFNDEFWNEEGVVSYCNDIAAKESTNKYIHHFKDLYWAFVGQNLHHKSYNPNKEADKKYKYGQAITVAVMNDWVDDSKSDELDKASWILDATDREILNESRYSKTYWTKRITPLTQDNTATKKELQIQYFPFLAREHLINANLIFNNINKSGKDVNQKWRKLIRDFKNSRTYIEMSDEVKNIVDTNIKNESLLENINAQYFLGTFADILNTSQELKNFHIPHLPSISYRQQMFLLHKLITWGFLKDTFNKTELKKNAVFTNTSKDFQKHFDDLTADNNKKLLELIDEVKALQVPTTTKTTWPDQTTSEKLEHTSIGDKEQYQQISNPDPLAQIDFSESVLTNKTLYEHLFGNIPTIEQKFSDLQTTYASKGGLLKYEKYESYSASGGPNATLSAIDVTSQSDKTLRDVLVETWKTWIKGEAYTEQDLKLNLAKPTTEAISDLPSGKKYIPSSNLLAYEEAETEKAKATKTKKSSSSDTDKPYSTTHRVIPSSWTKVYKAIKNKYEEALVDYINNKSNNRLATIQKFFNDNNLYRISFLLYNYAFNFDTLLKYSPTPDQKRKLYGIFNDLEINQHNSAIVANVGNISAKINDRSKLYHKFKLINNSNNSGKINKLKILSGNPLFEAKTDFLETLQKYQKNADAYVPSATFAPLLQLLKKVKYNDQSYQELFKDWSNYISSPYERTWEHGHYFNYHDYYKYSNAMRSIQKNNYNVQGSKITFEIDGYDFLKSTRTVNIAIPVPNLSVLGYIEQPTSFFALVSPEYAALNGLAPISHEQYHEFKKLMDNDDLTQNDWESAYYKFLVDKKNANHILNINEKKLIIVGTAQTPDFLFPTHSWLNIIPDKQKEGLVYIDKYAYKHFVKNSFIQFFESYISFKFPKVIKELKLEDVYINNMKDFMRDYSPESNSEFTLMSSNEGHMHLFKVRSHYANALNHKIQLFTWILLSQIASIVVIVVFVLVKKYIQKNMNVFGAFIANGTPKLVIILSSAIFALIPIVSATILGYVLSLITQKWVYLIIAKFWFLPIQYSAFTLFGLFKAISLALMVGLPISLISAYCVLHPNVSKLLKENALFKQSKFTNFLYKKMSKLTALWKFRLIVIFNALSQTLILISSSVTVFFLFNFFLHNLGKIKIVADAESDSKRYGNLIRYTSPIEQSGQYHLKSYFDLGRTFTDNIPTTRKVVYENDKLTELEFNKDNPQLVASNIFTPYHPRTFSPYNDCLNYLFTKHDNDAKKAFTEFNKEHIHIELDSIYRVLENRESDHYLNRAYIEPKNGQQPSNSASSTDKCAELTTNYKSTYAKSKVIQQIAAHPFYESIKRKDSEAETISLTIDDGSTTTASATATPTTTAGAGTATGGDGKAKAADTTKKLEPWRPHAFVGQQYPFATYLPVWEEKWPAGEVGKVETGKMPEIELYNEEPLFKTLHEFYTSKDYVPPSETWVNKETVGSGTDQHTLQNWFLSKLDQQSAKDEASASSTTTTTPAVPAAKVETISMPADTNKRTGSLERKQDFWIWKNKKDNKEYVLPTLSRLHKDNANYITININDFYTLTKDYNVFRNKVLTRFMIDHTFELQGTYGTKKFNIWDKIQEQLKKLYPELVITIDKNHYDFIEAILQSKYARFFIERFMTKHSLNTKSVEASDASTAKDADLIQILKTHKSGEIFNDKRTYSVYKDKLDPQFKDHIREGLYYIDVLKVFYFYNEFNNMDSNHTPDEKITHTDKHQPMWIMYRPDFLYFFYAIMNDQHFMKEEVAPIKFSFNYSIYNSDYNNFQKTFKITGDVTKDNAAKLGLTSEDGTSNYHLTPSGDQTFTYIQGTTFVNDVKQEWVTMTGIKQDSRGTYINLVKDGKNINHLLYEKVKGNEPYPIIINHYTAKKYNVGVGDVIELKNDNYLHRYNDILQKGSRKLTRHKLKVAGIYDSYFQDSFFISQKNANKILGLSDDYGFNAVFTKKFAGTKEPIQFQKAIGAYAQAGIFTDVLLSKKSSSFSNLLNSYPVLQKDWSWNGEYKQSKFKVPTNFEYLKIRNGLSDKSIADFMSSYTKGFNIDEQFAQGSVINHVENNSVINNVYFDIISNLIIEITTLFMFFLTPLLVFALLIITHLIIDDLKNLLTVLKLLGFTGGENSLPIVIYLSAILLWTTLVGTILFVVGINIFIEIIFNALKILMPIVIELKYFALSFGLLAAIFGWIILKSYFNIKNTYMPVAMKLLID